MQYHHEVANASGMKVCHLQVCSTVANSLGSEVIQQLLTGLL